MQEQLKRVVQETVDQLAPELLQVSRTLHANPELAYQEHQAVALLTGLLEEKGFRVTRGVAGLATAFVATHEKGPGPTIAFLAEYDALPGLGHACGHNLIGAASLGAALATVRLLGQVPGRVLLVGCPAEEKGGGKISLVEAGIFAEVDAAMLVHPSNRTEIVKRALGLREVRVEFFGKPAHAAATPHLGINALDAVIQSFNHINALRQHFPPHARVHGIITHGGEAPNIIPAYAAALFYVRALDLTSLETLYRRIVQCFHAAAEATGARVAIKEAGHLYQPQRVNYALSGLFQANLERLGVAIDQRPEDDEMGSTDVGNVSQVVPTIQPMIGIAPPDVVCHMAAFAEAAGSPRGEGGMLLAAKAMAMTAVDLLADSGALARVKADFVQGARHTGVHGGPASRP
ncbi:MAG: M20 family metallopeptidase [Candidatus Methylomirabilales bacterium]